MDKPERLFDVRIARRNIAAGVITQDEFDAWLAQTEDSAANAVRGDAKMVRGAVDDHSTIADED